MFLQKECQFGRIKDNSPSKAISQISSHCDPNFEEVTAARLAASLNLLHFTLEGDSQVIISALQNPAITQD
jgi:hypothetical protein